jgi:hypothetical protein
MPNREVDSEVLRKVCQSVPADSRQQDLRQRLRIVERFGPANSMGIQNRYVKPADVLADKSRAIEELLDGGCDNLNGRR